ncbi:MAG TPA: carboxylating nicotinate-nucleotide diphosphorylase, partial [Rhodospirillales bacterium]|nr:carboxylating nicotinate-nucleotide diphosphorylase [Rhodospirillales bacterium]
PIVEWGIREELQHGDHSAQLLDGHMDQATTQIYVKERGVICGVPVAKMTFEILDPDCQVKTNISEGDYCGPGDVIMEITGKAWIFSGGERLALDYLQHMSGIATNTNRYVKLVEPYGTRIADALKGIPPIRVLQKYAVRMGGGIPHMYSRHNAIVIKDNHIKMAGSITACVNQLRARGQHGLKIEVECESIEDVHEALAVLPDSIMFDNMELNMLTEAVKIVGDKVWTVGTGGVNEDTVVPIAKTGVKQIAIGGLVHSVKVIDISMDIGEMKDSAKRDIRLARAAGE